MRKILLGSASALALGLFTTAAMAGTDFWNQGYGKSSTDNDAVAVGVQLNSVSNDGQILIGSQGGENKSKSKTWDAYGGGSYGSSDNVTNQGVVNNANSIDGSFGGVTGLVNVNQNNGNNVSQDAQNTVAAIINCDCSSSAGFFGKSSNTDNAAVAVGLQASDVSTGQYSLIQVDVANQGNGISNSFGGATGLINVNQNNGNNVSQKAQNTVAAIIGQSKTH